MSKSTEKLMRYTLGVLLLLLAINAFGGGYYGIAGAKDIPTEWLEGSPFQNYFIPSLILFVGVGGSALVAAILVFRQHNVASKAAFICVLIVLVWLIVQVAIIGYVSWMQPTTAIVSFLILLLNWKLPKY
ncbi:MAG TPA: hypothetical protein DHV28_16510 [Ignavibacteriales bacterium]|nr:hypothetical protein [Ignavibacteriales bacterium]